MFVIAGLTLQTKKLTLFLAKLNR